MLSINVKLKIKCESLKNVYSVTHRFITHTPVEETRWFTLFIFAIHTSYIFFFLIFSLSLPFLPLWPKWCKRRTFFFFAYLFLFPKHDFKFIYFWLLFGWDNIYSFSYYHCIHHSFHYTSFHFYSYHQHYPKARSNHY